MITCSEKWGFFSIDSLCVYTSKIKNTEEIQIIIVLLQHMDYYLIFTFSSTSSFVNM